MPPQQALDLFSACARKVLSIEQIDQYNAAFVALSKVVADAAKADEKPKVG